MLLRATQCVRQRNRLGCSVLVCDYLLSARVVVLVFASRSSALPTFLSVIVFQLIR